MSDMDEIKRALAKLEIGQASLDSKVDSITDEQLRQREELARLQRSVADTRQRTDQSVADGTTTDLRLASDIGQMKAGFDAKFDALAKAGVGLSKENILLALGTVVVLAVLIILGVFVVHGDLKAEQYGTAIGGVGVALATFFALVQKAAKQREKATGDSMRPPAK